MLPVIAAIASLIPGIKSIFDTVNLPKVEREKLESAINLKIQETSNLVTDLVKSELEARSRLIEAEINGESWLQKNWRPIAALSFLVIIIGRGFNILPPLIFGKTELTILEYFMTFMGGYATARTAEKFGESISNAIIKRGK